MTLKDFSKVSFDPGQNAQAQQTSALMQVLPPELRNRIYGLVLGDYVPPPIRVAFGPNINPQPPGLLLACKQIHYEAIKIYWSEALFSFNTIAFPVAWLRKIGRRRRELLKHVLIETKGYPSTTGNWHLWDFVGETLQGMRQLAEYEKVVKGVAPGVIKVGLHVPLRNGTKMALCTSTPKQMALLFLGPTWEARLTPIV